MCLGQILSWIVDCKFDKAILVVLIQQIRQCKFSDFFCKNKILFLDISRTRLSRLILYPLKSDILRKRRYVLSKTFILSCIIIYHNAKNTRNDAAQTFAKTGSGVIFVEVIQDF